MTLMRALLRWQLFAVPVLPLWLLVGFGFFGGGAGAFFLLFLGAAILLVFLAVLAGVTRLRPSVRTTRALGRWDAAATVAFHLALVGLGFFGATGAAFGIVSAVLGLATFWLAVWELLREWRDRVSDAVARASSWPDRAEAGAGRPVRGRRPDDGDVIIVRENGH
ncbi:MFS transporter permease [Rathayibacter sp. KR2-224]|uniref:MFS transporter permease n=1 Tax=Rathayibacter sp. KR2-224 TaxID=3400913 RepID=UPI003C0C1241